MGKRRYGETIFFSAFAIIGLFLAEPGIRYLAVGWFRALTVEGWARAEGKVLSSDVEDHRLKEVGDGGGHVFRPAIRFAYSVAGRALEGDRRVLDEEYGGREEARDIAARYPAGAAVVVRYDAAAPEESALESELGLVARYTLGAFPFAIALACVLTYLARSLARREEGPLLRERTDEDGARRITLHVHSPLWQAFVGAFAAGVVVALPAGVALPDDRALAALAPAAAITALAAALGARRARAANASGRGDLVLDARGGRLRFPHQKDLDGRYTVVEADAARLEGAEVAERVESDGEGRHTDYWTVSIRLGDSGPEGRRTVPIVHTYRKDFAEAVEGWIEERVAEARRP